MATKTITITSRARNPGYAWSTTPTGRGTEITKPTKPTVRGGIRAIEEAMAEQRRVCDGGTYSNATMWVGDMEIVGGHSTFQEIVSFLRETGSTTAQVRA